MGDSDELALFEFFEMDNNLNNTTQRRRRQLTRELNDPFNLCDTEFVKQYRLTPDLAISLCEDLSPYLSQPTKSSDLPIETKVLTALSFYANGSYQRPTGEQCGLAMAQQTVSSVLAQVTAAINTLHMRNKYIKFPQTFEERSRNKLRFYENFGVPGVIGCIDGTHVAIVRPKEYEERFRCRKGYHSLNVQLICNADMQIISVDASHGGANHDSFIWSIHPLRNHLNEVSNNEGLWLLGDSGYPLRRTMMTPILDAPEGSPEAYYTDRHVSTRNIIERTIGILKARFRCLLVHRTLHYEPQVAGCITNACAILHNICNEANVPFEDVSEEEARLEAEMQPATHAHVDVDESATNSDLQAGIATRRDLVQRLWELRPRRGFTT